MAESPKRPAGASIPDASRAIKPAGATSETARAADSVPASAGPFTVLPTQFGRYRIEKLLGKGMMGAVYLAHDTQLDRPVAIKVARVSAAGSAKMIQRMETEAKAAAKIDHPLICKVYEFGEIDGIRFIAMQYIDGEDLKSYLNRVGKRRKPDEAIGWIEMIAGALSAAHAKGIIHRDLKPENIMLNGRDEPVIMDFGLARRTTGATNAGLTQGMILGTAAYMSPEQAIGKAEDIDQRTDLYALGVMLFEMLTGEWPFTGTTIQVMGQKTICEPPSPLSLNPGIPLQLAEVCHKMIAQKKEDRYATCAEVIAALEGVDSKAPAAMQTDVHPETETPAESDDELLPNFLTEPPPAPNWLKMAKVSPKERKASLAADRLKPLVSWWRDQPLPFRWTILGCSGTVMTLLAIVLFFRNGDALIKVDVRAEGVEVTFHNETLGLVDGTHEFKVKPGDQTLHIKSGNVEFDTEKFTLSRGLNPAITVELVKSEIVGRIGDEEIARKSLTVSSTGQTGVSGKTADKPKTGWQGWPLDAPPPAIAPFDTAQAKQYQEAWAAYLKIPAEYTNSIGMKFRLIPPGEFTMGSTTAEIDKTLIVAGKNEFWKTFIRTEEPQHAVILTRPVYFGVHEVTQAEYEQVMGKNPSHFSAGGGGKGAVKGMDTTRYPVENVNWADAAEFCAKLNSKDKLKPFIQADETNAVSGATGYRLPTEAEWEFACRAGATTRFWNGDDDEGLVPVDWFLMNAAGRPHAVGKLQANPFGLHDVHGNVSEWVQDWWEPSYYGEFIGKPALNPIGPLTDGAKRVIRCGDWINPAAVCRASNRLAFDPALRQYNVGFRVSLWAVGSRVGTSLYEAKSPNHIKTATSSTTVLKAAPRPEGDGELKLERKSPEGGAIKLLEITSVSTGMKLKFVPGGTFLMGSPTSEKDRSENEGPRHSVQVSQFYMGLYEVTQGEFQKAMGRNPAEFKSVPGKDMTRFPVEGVTWFDAVEFCNKLSEADKLTPRYQFAGIERNTDETIKAAGVAMVSGTGYRLPTEAEWEYACRGGGDEPFHFGKDLNGDKANVDGNFPFGTASRGTFLKRTTTAGSYQPNKFGLYDMHGNVWEWCFDVFDPSVYASQSNLTSDPVSMKGSQLRVLRGGSWYDGARSARSASRIGGIPNYNRNVVSGFRVVR